MGFQPRVPSNQGLRNPAFAFTLIEILVVVSLISLLMSLLMPAFRHAREATKSSVCASNQRQLAVAATAYTAANRDWMNPIEDSRPSSTAADCVEATFRVILFPFAGRCQHVFDCPAECLYIYGDPASHSEADERRTRSLSGLTTTRSRLVSVLSMDQTPPGAMEFRWNRYCRRSLAQQEAGQLPQGHALRAISRVGLRGWTSEVFTGQNPFASGLVRRWGGI